MQKWFWVEIEGAMLPLAWDLLELHSSWLQRLHGDLRMAWNPKMTMELRIHHPPRVEKDLPSNPQDGYPPLADHS